MSKNQPSWEKMNKIEAQEWENLAFEKCDKVNEEFLAHYFEPSMCLVCFKVCEFSILRTRRERFGVVEIVTRKWCTACGKYHMPQSYVASTNKRYRSVTSGDEKRSG